MSYSTTAEHDDTWMTPAVRRLIAINVVIFFLQLTVVRESDMLGWFGFTWSDLDHAPWTMGTYMFLHHGFWHLALNMYTLWLFGRRVETHWSQGKFTLFYLWCGLGGVIFHLLFVRDGYLVGASAATLGVMLAFAMRWPDEELLFFGVVPMKVKWLVILLAGLNVVQGALAAAFGSGGGVAYFAHLGGFAFGWLYLRYTAMQGIERLRHRISQVPDVPDETPRAIPRSLPRSRDREASEVDEVVAKSKAALAKRPAPRSVIMAKDPKVAALDSVLDKISEQGLDSLTEEERTLLEEMSRRLRND